MRIVASSTPASAAWAAYDAAMIRLQEMYADRHRSGDTPTLQAERLKQAEQVVKRWDAWRGLFLASGGEQ